MNRLAIELGVCAAVLLASGIVARVYMCKAERAEGEAKEATENATKLEALWRQAEAEKRELAAVLVRYDEAFIEADRQTQQAVKDYVKRNQKIEEADDDWSSLDLPSSVCDALSEFVCKDAASNSVAGTVREAGRREADNKQ